MSSVKKYGKMFFLSCHERGTKKNFWVLMRNRTWDHRIPRSDERYLVVVPLRYVRRLPLTNMNIVLFFFRYQFCIMSSWYRMQNAECRLDKKCRLGTKCRLQILERVKNVDWEFKVFFRLACDYRPSYNLLSVTP